MCLVAFQKIFRKIFSTVWKRRRKTRIQTQATTQKTRIQKTQIQKTRSRSEIAISPAREIAIDASRDCDRRRDLAKRRSRLSDWSSPLARADWSSDWRSARTGARTGLLLLRARALSLSLSLFFRKSFEVKIEVVIDFRGQRPFFSVNGFQFPENRIFRTNQTHLFSGKSFLESL